ncbi:hypothetical protein D3C87_1912010 [compost metagenome]
MITHCAMPLGKRSWPWPRPPLSPEDAGALTGGLLSKPRDAAVGAAATAGGATTADVPPVNAFRESLPKAELILLCTLLIKASSLPTLFSACLTLVTNCSLVKGLLT